MKELHQENETLKNRIEKITKTYQNESKYRTDLETKYVQLQQENERLKEIIENLTTMTSCDDNKQIKNTSQYKLDIYKSRIDKAIEYCDKEIGNIIANFDYIDTKDLENVRKILKGDDENGN